MTDLKPDNVMLIADPVAPGRERVKLLDFGIAKLARTGAAQTAVSAIMGTPRYMSPEQCRGAGTVDDRADVYSLGVILFEMVAGRLPFDGQGAGELIAQHLYKEPPALGPLSPEAPATLVHLIESLLRKSPAERPSMREVSRELEALASEHGALGARPSRALPIVATDPAVPGPSRTTSTLRGEREPSSQSGLLIAGMALAAGLLLIGVLWTFRQLHHSPPAPATPLDASRPIEAQTTPSPPQVPEPAPPVTWEIDTMPSGATVSTSDGRSLGTTPLSLSRPAQPGSVSLVLRLPGHVDRALTLSAQRDAHVRERLQPLPKRTGQTKGKGGSRPQPALPQTKGTSYED